MSVDVTVQARDMGRRRCDRSRRRRRDGRHDPGDAGRRRSEQPGDPLRGQIPVQVRATGGFVVVAAYGDSDLEPVHPGRIPFGVDESDLRRRPKR